MFVQCRSDRCVLCGTEPLSAAASRTADVVVAEHEAALLSTAACDRVCVRRRHSDVGDRQVPLHRLAVPVVSESVRRARADPVSHCTNDPHADLSLAARRSATVLVRRIGGRRRSERYSLCSKSRRWIGK